MVLRGMMTDLVWGMLRPFERKRDEGESEIASSDRLVISDIFISKFPTSLPHLQRGDIILRQFPSTFESSTPLTFPPCAVLTALRPQRT